MGRLRQKLKLELIPKKSQRMLTFKRRKECLKKKLLDITTLCGVDACMIIYDPDDQQHPEICSNKCHEIRSIFDDYTTKKHNPKKHKSFGLSDFLRGKAEEAEEELVAKPRYPEESVRDPTTLSEQLKSEAQTVKSRIDLMQESSNQYPDVSSSSSSIDGHDGGSFVTYNPQSFATEYPPQFYQYPPLMDVGSSSIYGHDGGSPLIEYRPYSNCGDYLMMGDYEALTGDYLMLGDYEASEYMLSPFN